MVLTDEQWYLLAIGAFDRPVRAFRLDPVLSVRLGVSTVAVHLHPAYVQKIRFKHRVDPSLLCSIPWLASHGDAYLDPKPNYIQVFGMIDGKRYRLVLKGMAGKNEIWISTFHRSSERDYRKRTKGRSRIR